MDQCVAIVQAHEATKQIPSSSYQVESLSANMHTPEKLSKLQVHLMKQLGQMFENKLLKGCDFPVCMLKTGQPIFRVGRHLLTQ